MPLIVQDQRLQIGVNGEYSSIRVPIDALTSRIDLRLARQYSGGPIVFPSASRLTTRIILRAGTGDFIAEGSVTGGVATRSDYSLSYGLPTGFFNSDTVHRLGERVSTFDAMVKLLLDGDPIDSLMTVETFSLAKPDWRLHHSVAFDATTNASEDFGDGVLSLTHTAAGSGRAAFAGNMWGQGPGATTSSITYAGNAMDDQWDIDAIAGGGGSGETISGDANVPASAQTVTSTVTTAVIRHRLGVISVNGVDSGTPTGTAVSSSSNSATPSVTCTSLTTDGLIVDSLACISSPAAAATVGANQTQRTNELSNLNRFAQSTQSSNDGGVMSWSLDQTPFGLVHGAIEFKPAAAASVGHGNLLLLGVG